MDELDEAVEVFCCDLLGMMISMFWVRIWTMGLDWTHGLVLLVKVVDVSVQYLDEELY